MLDEHPGADTPADPGQPPDREQHAVAVRADTDQTAVEPRAAADVDRVEAVDGELVDEADAEQSQPVDQPAPTTYTPIRVLLDEVASNRRPILPAWLHSAEDRLYVARWLLGHTGHVTAYHAVRMPLYGAVLAVRSPRGLLLVLLRAGRWTADLEAHSLRQHAIQTVNSALYLQLAAHRAQRVKRRLVLIAVTVGVLVAGGVAAWTLLPGWVLSLGMAGAVIVLGKIGTPADRPVISPAVVPTRVQQLRSEHVVRALKALGIAALSGKNSALTFPSPIMRDGPGWRAEVDLPYGVTATDVIEKRDRLASGLRRPLGCCWPEPVHDEHAGRLVLWVGDEPLNQMRPRPWPLLAGGAFDLFDPVPFVIDQRGRPVAVPLVFANVLIGAMPRMGKTFALRLLTLAAALDPYARLRIFELKGTGDLGMVERVAHRYASGAGADALEAAMESLRELYADLETRARTITRIAKQRPAECPENKVTRALCREPGLGLGLEVVIIDECQELFSNKEFRDDAERLCEGIIKRGPALGVILLLATQRPDAKSLPKSISDNIGIRFCLRVMGQEPNDMVLGTSSYKNGVRASLFTARDKGVGYLVGVNDDPVIGKTYGVDGPAADTVAERAYALREAAGTLSGDAVGEQPVRVDAVADVLRVAAGAERMWTNELLERLGGLRPEVYGAWTPAQLAAAMRPAGALPQQVWGQLPDGTGANRNGYVLAEITRPQLT